ncbi:hypothetical protein CBM2586_A11044 [Cupriavidus phytorum]|uniref:Uncharacterized protein n=1 Tax=Cupriavidus taiwanensis TaxID=164546 RepID=A0A975WRN5_9BURK|nr:hypothetical protein CBM2586_A11044 [Cupriavidus taiwanensis]
MITPIGYRLVYPGQARTRQRKRRRRANPAKVSDPSKKKLNPMRRHVSQNPLTRQPRQEPPNDYDACHDAQPDPSTAVAGRGRRVAGRLRGRPG